MSPILGQKGQNIGQVKRTIYILINKYFLSIELCWKYVINFCYDLVLFLLIFKNFHFPREAQMNAYWHCLLIMFEIQVYVFMLILLRILLVVILKGRDVLLISGQIRAIIKNTTAFDLSL